MHNRENINDQTDTTRIRDIVREEIQQFETRIDTKIGGIVKSKFDELEISITKKILREVSQVMVSEISTKTTNIEANNKQLITKLVQTQTIKNNNELAKVGDTKGLVKRTELAAITQQIKEVIVQDINNTIIPQVNKMVKWMNYNFEDGSEVLDSYRRHEMGVDDPLMLTSSAQSNRTLQPHVYLGRGFNELDPEI